MKLKYLFAILGFLALNAMFMFVWAKSQENVEFWIAFRNAGLMFFVPHTIMWAVIFYLQKNGTIPLLKADNMKLKIFIFVIYMFIISSTLIWMIASSQETVEFWIGVKQWAPVIYGSTILGQVLNLYFGKKKKPLVS